MSGTFLDGFPYDLHLKNISPRDKTNYRANAHAMERQTLKQPPTNNFAMLRPVRTRLEHEPHLVNRASFTLHNQADPALTTFKAILAYTFT